MSIKELPGKIKGLTSSWPEWEKDVFLGLLVVVVAVGGFGLGRLSRLSGPSEPVRIENLDGTGQVASAVMSVETEKGIVPSVGQGSVPAPASAGSSGVVKEAVVGQVVGSKNGTKYHLPDCSGAKRIKPENLVTFASVAEAQKAGYTPAANCPGLN